MNMEHEYCLHEFHPSLFDKWMFHNTCLFIILSANVFVTLECYGLAAWYVFHKHTKHTHIYMYMHTHTPQTQICTHAYTHTHMHACTHTRTHASRTIKSWYTKLATYLKDIMYSGVTNLQCLNLDYLIHHWPLPTSYQRKSTLASNTIWIRSMNTACMSSILVCYHHVINECCT